ncbi:MAG: hypothetical protein ACI4W6_03635 [Acutalibacteraceae bacterium]
MKKPITKKLLSLIAVIVAVCIFATSVYAVVITYSDVETTHLVALPTRTIDEIDYTGVGGIATGKTKDSMFVLKAERQSASDGSYTSHEQKALFYDFPDIENLSNRHYYTLPYAGHANGMAIDDQNIYVCGWTTIDGHVDNQENNEHNNWIIMIPRKIFTELRKGPDGVDMPKDNRNTEEVEGYSILYPKVKSVAADGTVTYSDYENVINRITLHGSNGSFIIGYEKNNLKSEDYNLFTTAELETYNGKTLFVVSESPDDIFAVENNIAYKNATNQDICYAPGHGLFIPKWYGTNLNDEYYKPTKTVILWADIDGAYTTRTIGNMTVKYYIPNRINVDKSGSKYNGSIYKFESFEIESIAFTQDGDMLFSCNIRNTEEYKNIANYADSVFKLTHDNGQQFVLN